MMTTCSRSKTTFADGGYDAWNVNSAPRSVKPRGWHVKEMQSRPPSPDIPDRFRILRVRRIGNLQANADSEDL